MKIADAVPFQPLPISEVITDIGRRNKPGQFGCIRYWRAWRCFRPCVSIRILIFHWLLCTRKWWWSLTTLLWFKKEMTPLWCLIKSTSDNFQKNFFGNHRFLFFLHNFLGVWNRNVWKMSLIFGFLPVKQPTSNFKWPLKQQVAYINVAVRWKAKCFWNRTPYSARGYRASWFPNPFALSWHDASVRTGKWNS